MKKYFSNNLLRFVFFIRQSSSFYYEFSYLKSYVCKIENADGISIYFKWFTCLQDRTGILETFEIDFLFMFSPIGNIIYDAFLILDLTLMLAVSDGWTCLCLTCLNERPVVQSSTYLWSYQTTL